MAEREKLNLTVVDIGELIYPTPRERKEEVVETPLKKGDVVRILIGPATGKIGIVVVERNGNYVDYEPYANAEAIGVRVAEEAKESKDLAKFLDAITQRPNSIQTVTRWFDDETQLEVMFKPE
jgi:hypothetical protein